MKFADEFAQQMENMLRELATALDPSGSAGRADASASKPKEETNRSKPPFAEKIVERTASALSNLAEGKTDTAEELGDAFQTRLNAAMARLHSSDTSLQVNYW
jgi:hypothetical protein